MSRRRRRWVASTLALLLASPCAKAQPAAAQPGGEEDPRKAEARAHFQRGLELSEDESWDAAFAEYTASLAIHPTKAAAKNAGLCLRMLHRYAESVDMLERMATFASLTDADRAFVARELADLERFVGVLLVRSPDAGALVTIDGGDRGRTPIVQALKVSAGSHTVRVLKPGFAPYEQQVVVAGGQSLAVDVRLSPLAESGRLRVAVQGGGAAHVLIDGADVGKTPWEDALPVGMHTAALRGEGALGAQPVSVPVRLNDRATITLVLEPLEGRLRIEPAPANAIAALDGVTLGRGVWEGPVRLGAHRIEVADEGFLPARQAVTLDHATRSVVAVQLERDLGSPMWRGLHPPHFFFAARGALPLSPSLGSDVEAGCSGGCSAGAAYGLLGELGAGYELSSGFGFSIDGGYAWAQRSVSGRPDDLQPLPAGSIPSDPGRTNDKLGVQGPLVTVSASLHRGERLSWLARIAVGGWLGTTYDTRSGTYTTVLSAHPNHTSGSPASYSVGPLEQSVLTGYGVLGPEVGVGWHLGRLEIGASLELLVAVPFTTPRWQPNAAQVVTGNCGAKGAPGCVSDGLAVYGASSFMGNVVVLVAPGLFATYPL
jgi:hypothetical protein